MDAKYNDMTLPELMVAARQADWDVKQRNCECIAQFKRIWDDKEYLRLLELADWIDKEVARRKEIENAVG